jgi:hypothetical protein
MLSGEPASGSVHPTRSEPARMLMGRRKDIMNSSTKVLQVIGRGV